MSLRIALFCSLYRGKAMLETLLALKQSFPEITISGVATDDPTKSWVMPTRRIWQYPHSSEEEQMVFALSKQNNISTWKDRINTEDFFQVFSKEWAPDVCYMGVFGQKIPEKVWSYPLYGFYNFHTCGGEFWPSDAGGDPLKNLLLRGKKQASLAMHEVDNFWDHGNLLAFSDFFPIHNSDSPMSVQKRSAPLASQMMSWHIKKLLGVDSQIEKPRFVSQSSLPALSLRDAGDSGLGERIAQAADV